MFPIKKFCVQGQSKKYLTLGRESKVLYLGGLFSNASNKDTLMQVPEEILGDAQLYLHQH
jgi:hypothetical protein